MKISNPILGFKVASDWINVGVWVITNNTGMCFALNTEQSSGGGGGEG